MNAIRLAAAVCCVALTSTIARAASDPPSLAPFGQFVAAMNVGDIKKAEATFAPSPTIIDEFGVHIWHSFSSWSADLGASSKTEGVSDFHIALSPVSFKDINAKSAYGVVPSTLTFKVKGKPITEKGMFTFSTVKTTSGWRITGWAWSTL